MKNHVRFATAFIFLSLLLNSGCVLPSTLNFPGTSTELGLPHPGSIYSLGQAVSLAAFARYPTAGPTVEGFTFYSNALEIAEAPLGVSGTTSRGDSWTTGDSTWTPPAAGEYQIQAWARLSNGRLNISGPARICVLDISFHGYTDSLPPYGYTGPCEVPSSPVTDPSAAVRLTTTPSPISIGYATETCPAAPPATITFYSTVDDPGNRAAFVAVDIVENFHDVGSTTTSGPALALTQTSSVGTTKIFSGSTYDMTSDLGDSTFGPPGIVTITWTARAYDRSGAILVTDGPHDLLAAPCDPPVHPLILATPTIVPVPTETPQGLCPPGTYYAPVTHQCIPIQINPTKSGGPNCAQYTTDTSCNAAPGCSYDYVAKKCKAK
jgi:hypothetical protein